MIPVFSSVLSSWKLFEKSVPMFLILTIDKGEVINLKHLSGPRWGETFTDIFSIAND